MCITSNRAKPKIFQNKTEKKLFKKDNNALCIMFGITKTELNLHRVIFLRNFCVLQKFFVFVVCATKRKIVHSTLFRCMVCRVHKYLIISVTVANRPLRCHKIYGWNPGKKNRKKNQIIIYNKLND